MATTVNIRLDDELKREIETLYEGLGLDISTATRMFYKQCLRNRALPFTPSMAETTPRELLLAEWRGVIRDIQEESVRNGTDGTALEEINAIIGESRRERKAKR